MKSRVWIFVSAKYSKPSRPREDLPSRLLQGSRISQGACKRVWKSGSKEKGNLMAEPSPVVSLDDRAYSNEQIQSLELMILHRWIIFSSLIRNLVNSCWLDINTCLPLPCPTQGLAPSFGLFSPFFPLPSSTISQNLPFFFLSKIFHLSSSTKHHKWLSKSNSSKPLQRERAVESQGSVLPWLRSREPESTSSAAAPPPFSAGPFKEMISFPQPISPTLRPPTKPFFNFNFPLFYLLNPSTIYPYKYHSLLTNTSCKQISHLSSQNGKII